MPNVDVTNYSRDDVPAIGALPPEDHVNYVYYPKPIERIPPVGHNWLLQLYHCHEDGLGYDHCLRSIPKHRAEEVTSDLLTRPLRGWGIELVEGVNWRRFIRYFISLMIF